MTVVEHVHKIRLWDKNSALEKLAKHLGMFVERVEHTGKNGDPIQHEVKPSDKLAAYLDMIAGKNAE